MSVHPPSGEQICASGKITSDFCPGGNVSCCPGGKWHFAALSKSSLSLHPEANDLFGIQGQILNVVQGLNFFKFYSSVGGVWVLAGIAYYVCAILI